MHALTRLALIPALAVTLFSFTGCETSPNPGAVPAGLAVDASRNSVLAGENVTFTATTTNTMNRDASIEWTTTGGTLEKVTDDRVSRVTFDEAGEYKVSADLLLDGERVATEITKIYVSEVK